MVLLYRRIGSIMKKILIKIKNNTLIFKEKSKITNQDKNLLNTNIISRNELIFSDEYILLNKNIISSFINELCETYKLDTAIIEQSDFNELICNLFHNNKYITNLILKEDIPITYNLCEIIIKTSIKNINCYNIQPFMIELLDKYNITIESRNEILFISNFMKNNNLNTLSNIYYKTTLQIEFPITEQDEEDFKTFCKINKYLKNIHIIKANISDYDFIINNLKSTSHKYIKIILHDNITNENKIKYLKEFNKKKRKKYKISFIIKYTDDYINKNFVKQTNSEILNVCCLIIILLVMLSFGYVFYNNYSSMKKDDDIKKTVNNVIENTNPEEIIANIEKNNIIENKPKLKIINDDIASLLTINPDTIGWLKVNNTNIDYPVVQAINNEYYLKHNFNFEKDNSGWVFLNYQNSYKE